MKNGLDALFHPLFLDVRFSGELNLYKPIQIDRDSSDCPIQNRRDRQFDVQHIRLDLTINEQQKEISGCATITLKPFLHSLTDITLDAAALNIRSVSLGGQTLDFETLPKTLVITLDRPYTCDESLTLAISYSAKPQKGMFFIEPDKDYPNKPSQVWTQGQPDDSSYWFPCFNEPADKCSSEMVVTVNSKYMAISNGKLVEVSEDKAHNTKTFHWRQEKPHASYLFSLVVGEYEEVQEEVEGCQLRYFVYKGHKEQISKIYGRTPAMLKLFAEKFGTSYPFDKYSQVLVADFTFQGMENTSATTLTDILLEWALTKPATAQDISHDELIAHELAHQWWGDLVTCKSWAHNWLNEGFATYSEVLWQEHALGTDGAAVYRMQDCNLYWRQDLAESRRPIVTDRYHYSVELFDRHAYQKGALVLHMLRQELGEAAFFKGIQYYLQKHALGVVETHDLKVALEEVTGRQLDSFFQQWVYRAGYPEFKVTSNWDRTQQILHLHVAQTQQVDSQTPLFRIPINIEITTAEGVRNCQILIDRAEADYYFPLSSKPLMVIFDKGEHVLKTLEFSKSKEEYLYQLKNDSSVLGRIRAARELSAFEDDQVIDSLQDRLLTDPAWAVGVAAAATLGEFKNLRARQALEQGYKKSRHAYIRRACVWGLGHQQVDDQLIDLLRQVIDTDDSDFVVAIALQALANTKSERAYDLLVSALARESYRDVIRAATFTGLAHLKDKRAIELAIQHSKYGRPVPVRDAAIRFLGDMGKGEEKAFERLMELLTDASWRARFMTVRALGKLQDKRTINTLKNIEQTEVIDHIKSLAHGIRLGLEAQAK